jgi:hypothetical protein
MIDTLWGKGVFISRNFHFAVKIWGTVLESVILKTRRCSSAGTRGWQIDFINSTQFWIHSPVAMTTSAINVR